MQSRGITLAACNSQALQYITCVMIDHMKVVFRTNRTNNTAVEEQIMKKFLHGLDTNIGLLEVLTHTGVLLHS